MAFNDESDLKFYTLLSLILAAVLFVFYLLNSVVKDPYAKCQNYCAGKNDDVAGTHDSKWPVECLCSKDVRDTFWNRKDIKKP